MFLILQILGIIFLLFGTAFFPLGIIISLVKIDVESKKIKKLKEKKNKEEGK